MLKKDNGGKRYNSGKLRWDLLPIQPLQESLKVLTQGSVKYEPYNWYRGMKYSISYASGQRHRTKWWMGERNDPESGLHHLAHSVVNDLFNLTFELENRKHLDDRVIKGNIF